ncbi:MAG: UDP-N-acetylmuramoyl-tripeptide--D-alanyl-D-alanine ligase [Candidatus Paceibacterota bacterium]|jgi:UDP-N-acetylmuramoyl-tripeptide--D-alanyl-D-alanine ligase
MDLLAITVYLAIFFWAIKQAKAVFFWLYLWQLKNYHLGRFIAHFSTAKGQEIFLNKIFVIKISLLVLFFFASSFGFLIWWAAALVLFYAAESVHSGLALLSGKAKRPIWTGKALFLSASTFAVIFYFPASFFYVYSAGSIFLAWLLFLDILAPAIVSGTVLALQPITAFLRSRTIAEAKARRAQFKNLTVIGITGSCGKSSAKEFLAEILSKKYRVLKTPKNQNSEIGISRTILGLLKPEHQIFICEMGGYDIQGIKLLTEIAKPQIGILTCVNSQHLATFGSQENITKAKFKLIESLPGDGTAVVNIDNDLIRKELQSHRFAVKKIRRYSAKGEAEIWAENVEIKKAKTSFEIFSRDGEFARIEMDMPGGWPIVSNVLAAAAAAKELKMSLPEIGRACQKIDAKLAPVSVKRGIEGLNIIDSSYSANPDGVIADLDYLNVWVGKKIVVMPSLIELGKASAGVHKNIGDKIGQVCDLAIITSLEGVRDIKEGAMERGLGPEKILFMENPKAIVGRLKKELQRGDTVLLEGRVPEGVLKLLEGK